jgi:hypothetical protein
MSKRLYGIEDIAKELVNPIALICSKYLVFDSFDSAELHSVPTNKSRKKPRLAGYVAATIAQICNLCPQTKSSNTSKNKKATRNWVAFAVKTVFLNEFIL